MIAPPVWPGLDSASGESLLGLRGLVFCGCEGPAWLSEEEGACPERKVPGQKAGSCGLQPWKGSEVGAVAILPPALPSPLLPLSVCPRPVETHRTDPLDDDEGGQEEKEDMKAVPCTTRCAAGFICTVIVSWSVTPYSTRRASGRSSGRTVVTGGVPTRTETGIGVCERDRGREGVEKDSGPGGERTRTRRFGQSRMQVGPLLFGLTLHCRGEHIGQAPQLHAQIVQRARRLVYRD